MLFGETVAVYCENHTERINTNYLKLKEGIMNSDNYVLDVNTIRH
jgi:hypothetical protein